MWYCAHLGMETSATNDVAASGIKPLLFCISDGARVMEMQREGQGEGQGQGEHSQTAKNLPGILGGRERR